MNPPVLPDTSHLSLGGTWSFETIIEETALAWSRADID
jgi:hypothetical protein